MTPEQRLDMMMAEPSPKDSVVLFKVQFDGSPKTYSYAAVKAPTLWFCTGGGDAFTQGRSWGDLLTWLDRKGGTVVAMQLATSWETL